MEAKINDEEKCPLCLGNKRCRNCNGQGCSICNYKKVCIRCGGTGKKALFLHEKAPRGEK